MLTMCALVRGLDTGRLNAETYQPVSTQAEKHYGSPHRVHLHWTPSVKPCQFPSCLVEGHVLSFYTGRPPGVLPSQKGTLPGWRSTPCSSIESRLPRRPGRPWSLVREKGMFSFYAGLATKSADSV